MELCGSYEKGEIEADEVLDTLLKEYGDTAEAACFVLSDEAFSDEDRDPVE